MINIKEGRDNVAIYHFHMTAIPRVKKAIRSGFFEMGVENRNHLRKKLTTGGRSGRIYFLHGRRHQASKEGEPPAKMTGRLSKSVKYTVNGWHSMTFGDTAFYGGFLEDGTKRMGQRPHIEATALERAGKTKQIMDLSIRNAFSRLK